MIKQKKEFEEWKKKEGDSDLVYNEKDNKERKPEQQSQNSTNTLKFTILCKLLLSEDSKSISFKELEKKLDREIKKVSEELIKEKLDKKKLDYDTISLILEVFAKSNFQWKPEHFETFDSAPEKFRGKTLPKNNRECVMLGIRLGTMRGKIIYNLRNSQITEKQRQEIDDLTWNLVWYSWQEARILHNRSNEKK